jgi:hypothetical protein
MDMKKILSALDNISERTVQGTNDMKKFVSIIRESSKPVGENIISGFEEGSVGGDANAFLIAADKINDLVMSQIEKIKINADEASLRDMMTKFNAFMTAYHNVGKGILQPDMFNDSLGEGVTEGDYPDGSSIKTPGSEDWKQQYQQAVMAVKNAKTQQEYDTASDRAGRIKDLLASKGINVGPILGQQGTAEGSRKAWMKHNNLVDLDPALKGLEDEMEKFIRLDPKEKRKYQQGIKQRIKSDPMAGPKGVLPEQGVAEGYPSDDDMGTVAGTNDKMTLGQWKQMWQKKMPNADMSLFRFPPNMKGSAIAYFDGWVNSPGARWDPVKSSSKGVTEDKKTLEGLSFLDYLNLAEATGKQKGVDGKACWDGYKRMGTKKKGGKTVDNCVPTGKK